MKYHHILVALAAAVLVSCGSNTKEEQTTQGEEFPIASVTEAYQTERIEADNIDSPAIWHGPNGEHWCLATAKSTDVMVIYDAVTGETIQRYGETGTGEGQYMRPNGVAVIDDMMIVVERDNHRVQITSLPDLQPLAVFGADKLVKPYGIAVYKNGENTYRLYVTDNYETPDEQVPPAEELDKRVHIFECTLEGGSMTAKHVSAFGETSGEGVLHVVESIALDAEQNLLLIADEDASENTIKVYDLEGKFNGKVLGSEYIYSQPEGIVLYECDNGEGYWIITNQSHEQNVFSVLDRKTFQRLGSFEAVKTANTDGIALTQKAFGPFERGAFFAVHDDGNVSCIDWKQIAGALNLHVDCTQ